MTIAEIIKNKRNQLNLTLRELAEKISLSHPYLSQIENNATKNPPSEEVLLNLASALQMTENEKNELLRLAALERTPPLIKEELTNAEIELEKLRKALAKSGHQLLDDLEMTLMPVYSGVRAGADGVVCYGEILFYDYFPKMKNIENKRNVKVIGDSMEPRIPNDSIVTINLQPSLDNGDIGVFFFNGDEGIVKKFYNEGKFIRLVSFNQNYKDIIVLPSDDFRIAGKVIQVISKF